MVAAHHRDEVDAYAAEFGGLRLQGGQSVEQKEAAKAAFQQQPAAAAPVISVAIGAGGVGHTLTAARIGIQAEQAWTPGEIQQMKKRLHRIGQDRPVDYYITVAEGTIDEHLWQVVTAKQATLDAVLDGGSDQGAGDDEASVAAELTWRLTQQGLSGAQPVGTSAARARLDRGSSVRRGDHEPGAAATAPPRRAPRDHDQDRGRRENRSDDDIDHHETGSLAQSPGTCAVCGTAMTIIQHGQTAHPLCEEDPDGAKAAAARPVYGTRDEITVRHWRQAHVDQEKVRAWCRETGRAEPSARGALPAELVGDYLAERGAADIPMPGGLSGADLLTQRPTLRQPFTAQLGWRNGPAEPLTVAYGPCPRCGGPTSALPGESLPPCLDCASQASRDRAQAPPGSAMPPPGGTALAEHCRNSQPDKMPVRPLGMAEDCDDDQAQTEASASGRRLREFAHRYLEEGLWPVPAWGTRPGGECCCPRGANCPRPGKHPRSVHAGPGSRDYSWKPLACRSHAEVDQRFGPGSRYAAGNLMVAIPPGMMAIDRDDDDGGHAAIAELAGELGELPPTLAHRTPHGEHLIYRTPPGWEGRAWVGKDPANPIPAGVDLRMPGQILMAAPSVVPGGEGPARYGPVSVARIAALPAAYLIAWTPPVPALRPPSRPIPVPPDGADRAVRYLHDAMTDIAAELASRPPGGRNSAAYTAGLKAGSLLGAARATPGAEQAAAAWTDEAAEQALIDAAQRNGYVDKDGESEARHAIRSGLRNGLRRPRTLPDFATTRTALAAQPRQRAAAPGRAQPRQSQASTVGAPRAGRSREPAPTGIRHGIDAADQATSIASRDEHQDAGTNAPSHDSPRMRANRAAVAANQAYRAGDLDAAQQLTQQAAALDAARADLWQQHQEQIIARRLILDAQAAYADGDHQRVQDLLGQARRLDPRMPAIWDGDLPGLPPARTTRHSREHAAEPGPDGPPGSSPAARGIANRQQVRAAAAPVDREAPQPSWPESPSRGGPSIPAPRAAVETGRAQPSPRRDAAAVPREPETRAGIATGDMEPGAEAPDDEPSTRWPAPNPHAARMASPPGRQSVHVVDANRATAPPERAGTVATAEVGDKTGSERPVVPPPDWRDRLLADARQPSQPGPGQPRDPSPAISPERRAPSPGIEPDT